ncbi:class I SAM-dependent methyltransferase [Caenimonas aquaedulcis]|uniref:Class I SAM-dependent methyltransferase n=1 Tax=Caenimonas aquaedulcis TaxID=2793270 RepID=A0A931H491_9BURK|nr:class I SAM-dependent methyltransferase [Caenimonas aquaedulcis]MBG9388185.1 class I SAM-dependent methyltransferase [Caenimonas aquaedulcis]
MAIEAASPTASEEFVRALFELALQRQPRPGELGPWVDASRKLSPAALLNKMGTTPEFLQRTKVKPFFPNGHYHSAVVDPSTVADYVAARSGRQTFAGIDIDRRRMDTLWEEMAESIRHAPFPDQKEPGLRFHYEGGPFPYGDALTLHGLMGRYKPKRIVEIGSGFSTACMLDSADIHEIDVQITCIEPFPQRLRSLLRPLDSARITLIEQPVQSVPVEDVVGALEEGDILFVDSTHVLKTASDVHYELTELIPAVKKGVLVHVHDCPYPFEYPQLWIERNYSWNEVYALRAFLMFNSAFKILFWGGMFRRMRHQQVIEASAKFAKNAGSSIWLVRES